MKEILYNNDSLTKEEINNKVERAKIVIVNLNNEILLGYSKGEYQIIGGHLKAGETYDECVTREVSEETGINIPYQKREPFIIIRYYTRDYPKVGQNTEYIAKYFEIKTDLKPNINKMSLDKEEQKNNFEFEFIKLDKVIEILENSIDTANNPLVVKDTIEVIKEYLKKRIN